MEHSCGLRRKESRRSASCNAAVAALPERLAQFGLQHLAGARVAETNNGLYKAELIHRLAPWKYKAAVELASLDWVAW